MFSTSEPRAQRIDQRVFFDNDPGTVHFKNAIRYLISALGAWLILVARLSQAATRRVLKVVRILVALSIRLGILVGHTSALLEGHIRPEQPPPLDNIDISLPSDSRTAISALSIDPTIIRSVHCPKCFTAYLLDGLPDICDYRETPRSRPCQEPLWATRATRGGPRRVPRRLYCTQDFASWLEFLLSRPGIEDLIDQSYNHQRRHPTFMESIWDSPAWRSLGTFTTTEGNLTFSYFIDWFNPFSNKIAGKHVSCGAIMLVCLNLPYDIRHRPENTFFAGITPPPKEPTYVTISSLQDPIVHSLRHFYNGRVVRTFRHPAGIRRRVAVLPVLGDLQGIHKAMGFVAVTSDNNPCSYCTITTDEFDNIDTVYPSRVGADVVAAAVEWRQATTKTRRKELVGEKGIRWSSLHLLEYRDPVAHTMLGVMHNWYEGVLQHHVRYKWGLGIPSGFQAKQKTVSVDLAAETDEDSRSELSDNSYDSADSTSTVNTDGESQPEEAPGRCIFSKSQLAAIRECIAATSIPSWVDRPPTNLGETSHGKLKADQWLSLFLIFFPLCLPEIWSFPLTQQSEQLLQNFYQLTTCTIILSAYSTSDEYADSYTSFYKDYRHSSKQLFPHIATRPNHHYAMHNGMLLKFWGPLIQISEFPFERHNGELQRVKTNNHSWDMDYTMLRHISQRGRLLAHLDSFPEQEPQDNRGHIPNMLLKHGVDLLRLDISCSDSSIHDPQRTHRPAPKLTPIPEDEYLQVLDFLNRQPRTSSLRHYAAYPHPLPTPSILPKSAILRSTLAHNTRDYSVFHHHQGQSSVAFRNPLTGQQSFGFICSIWQLCTGDPTLDDGEIVVVAEHRFLHGADHGKDIYRALPNFMTQIAYDHPLCLGENVPPETLVIIRKVDIQNQVPFHRRPPGSFGISRPTILLTSVLSRLRLGY
ncbi:hypothetical protein CC1G_01023 [Coprinopsis cinerea okayama7|uniref:Uncharacterized protein n=1 Tax=Coprinopsis cinerea (strain Okayama-7 / 130 / ATCC MYA-4618 / FGSC 9003) TaxID=240176 RepID=A8NE88_COPC7|nr:hypothetical protein CC1G_01023 [Coprinopsis cinerea okayama7\|eukprot:XP_001832961.2 hypothetical protein CC1G_01023 [Coprinopsis cinerea okayama7\